LITETTNRKEHPMITLFPNARRGRSTGSVRTAALATLVAPAAAACDKSSTSPESQTTATIELHNNANVPIVSVQIATCGESEWGTNKLNQNESIASGGARSFSITPGCYDVRASTATKAGIWRDREAAAGGTVYLALPASAGS
jgi:hypothetical protein